MGYLNLVDGFIYGDPVFRAKLDALAENDAYLKDNGWNTNTKTLFYQAAVPTGWTKDVTLNDKFLRVVNTTGGGNGGTQAPSSAITLAHSAHSITAASDHDHDLDSHTHSLAAGGTTGTSSSTNGLSSKSGKLRNRIIWTGAGGSISDVLMKNQLNNSVGLTSGSAGTHNHGGNSSGSALTDVTFAYCDIIIGGKDAGGGTYTDLTSEFGSGDIINFDPFVELAENDEYNYTRLMEATTVMIFGQVSAPLGWTKVATTNDKMLRFVSGSGGGTGGTDSPSSAVTMSHTHSTPSDSGHTHTVGSHSHDMNYSSGTLFGTDTADEPHWIQADGSGVLRKSAVSGPASSYTVYEDETTSGGSGNTGTNIAHTHTLATSGTNFTLSYLDVIQCSKDSAGAPYAYEDVTTGVFGHKRLVSKQKLNKLAKNDEYILFHTPESLTKAFFFMSSVPITWTKLTTIHDKGLRIVSGSSGGTTGGGSQLMSVALSLAHTHTLNSVSHTHTVGTHTHTLASTSESANAIGSNGYGPTGANNSLFLYGTGAGTTITNTSGAASGNTDSDAHDHGGVSGSALTDITLAYADILYAEKD